MCLQDNVNGLIWLKNVIHKLSHYVAWRIIICDDHNSSRLAFHHRYTHGVWAFPHELSELSCNQNGSRTQINYTVYRMAYVVYIIFYIYTIEEIAIRSFTENFIDVWNTSDWFAVVGETRCTGWTYLWLKQFRGADIVGDLYIQIISKTLQKVTKAINGLS